MVFDQDVLSTELDLQRPDGMVVSDGHTNTSSSGQVIRSCENSTVLYSDI